MSRQFLAALALCLSSAGCRSRPDSSLASFVPADATLLASVQVVALRNAPLYRKLPRLDEFASRATEWLIASNGRDTVCIARGHFQASAPGYTVIDDSTALRGTPKAVRAAIEQHRSGISRAAADLFERGRAIRGQHPIWAVSRGTKLHLSGNAQNLSKLLDSFEEVTLVADLGSGVDATTTGACRTEQEAQALADNIRGLLSLWRLSAPQNQPEFRVEQQRRFVKVTAVIPEELAMTLLSIGIP